MTALLGPSDTLLSQDWVPVCAYDDLVPERGVAALVDDLQVAVFRTYDGQVYAVANTDPFSGAQVLSRGIVGSAGPTPTVASPMFKQVFDLRTGECLTDRSVSVPTYPVSWQDGVVRLGVPTHAVDGGRP